MAPFKLALTTSHRFQNRLQTVLIMGSMALLLGLCGEFLLGEGAFLWIAMVTTLSLIITPQIPVWALMRLYRAQPLTHEDAPELIRIIETLALRAKLQTVPALYYVPSIAANAFTLGTPGEAAVAVTDGLLRRLNTRELAGVLAHEISHLSHHDIRVMGLADLVSRLTGLMSSIGLLVVIFTVPLWLLLPLEVSWLGLGLLLVAPTIAELLQAALSRTREFHADLGAVELTGDPEGFASALAKIEYPSYSWLQRIFLPQGGESAPSSLRSHPPTEERIRRLLLLAPQRARFHGLSQAETRDAHPDLPRMVVIIRRPRRHWSGLWY